MRQRLQRQALAATLTAVLASVPFGVLLSSCANDTLGNKGAACERASECAGGLVCVEHLCGDDLGKLDGGTAASFTDTATDALSDAAPSDGDEAMPPKDTGMAKDSGMPKDTGTPPDDTGTAPIDTGPGDTGPADTGTAPLDSASPADATLD